MGRTPFDTVSYFDRELQRNTFPFCVDFFLTTCTQCIYRNVGQYQKSHGNEILSS